MTPNATLRKACQATLDWIGGVVNDDACWAGNERSLPVLTQEQWNKLVAVQDQINAAMREPQ